MVGEAECNLKNTYPPAYPEAGDFYWMRAYCPPPPEHTSVANTSYLSLLADQSPNYSTPSTPSTPSTERDMRPVEDHGASAFSSQTASQIRQHPFKPVPLRRSPRKFAEEGSIFSNVVLFKLIC